MYGLHDGWVGGAGLIGVGHAHLMGGAQMIVAGCAHWACSGRPLSILVSFSFCLIIMVKWGRGCVYMCVWKAGQDIFFHHKDTIWSCCKEPSAPPIYPPPTPTTTYHKMLLSP